ncbi:MAG TPA: amino acid adenylation domain-containing protein [Chloroflexia bacterium]|nr:amino acid adenylation domain-containing protein [Chloroflexia bacterium]
MTPDEILNDLAQRGVKLWSEDGRLRFRAPEGILTEAYINLLKQHKAEILTLLEKPANDEGEIESLSYGQRAIWFLYQTAPDSAAYNVAFTARIHSSLNLAALRQAFQALVERHPTLRTGYSAIDGKPGQQIRRIEVGFEEIDASGWNQTTLNEAVEAAYKRPFDLEHDCLLRVSLFRQSDQLYTLLLTVHHIAADGWSLWLLLDELRALYPAYCNQRPAVLPLPVKQYSDYVRWQQAANSGQAGEKLRAYWEKQLAGAPAVLELPTDRPRPAVQTYNGASHPFEFDQKLAQQLSSLAKAHGVTMYTLLLAAFQALLYRYTCQEDILVGAPTFGRERADFSGIVGDFVNSVVLRGRLSGEMPFTDFLAQSRTTVLEALAHQDYPFTLLVEQLQPERDPSRSPLFQVVFVLQRPQLSSDVIATFKPGQAGSRLNFGGLAFEPVGMAQQEGQFDLTLEMFETGQELFGNFKYNTDLFDAATVARLAGHFKSLLADIVAHPTRSIGRLTLLTVEERQRLLAQPEQSFNADQPLTGLFEQQVARTPGAAALSFEGQTLTYAELNRRANQVAHYLRRLGVGPDVPVGLYMERSLDLMVALLGILKAGGCYLPIDPDYPPERLAFMLEDAQAPVLLTQKSLKPAVQNLAPRLVCLDEDWPEIARESELNPSSEITSANLAYIIYTSGSTGRPKGVQIEHRQVVRLFGATDDWYSFNEKDVWTLFHSYAFDFSVWEIWGALLYGGKLVVVPQLVTRSPEAFYRLLAREGVTVLNQTPSAFRQLIQAEGMAGKAELALRYVIFGGEALELASLKLWFERHGDQKPQLVNMYGITETTVHVTYRPLSLADLEKPQGSVIGVPIPDLQLYLLDQHRQPVPEGVPGELYVGGAGLARGYLNRPELTAERFIPNPFSTDRQARLYKTGDLARRRADGELEYLGRIDHQVKIRGFRIELGEIETLLAQHPGVQESLVLPKNYGNGDQRLVAYLVPDRKRAYTVRQLQRLQKEGFFERRPAYELPNGMTIAHLNKTETDFLYQEIYEEKSYLNHGISLEEGAVIFDVGANIGLFSLFAGQVAKNATIYAFEPVPPIFEALQTNAALYDHDIKLFKCGLSGQAGSATFTFYSHVSVISGRFADAGQERETVKAFILNQHQSEGGLALSDEELDRLLEERLSSEQFSCELRTLSEIIRENGVERIDLLKIDVEKSELEVLAGLAPQDWPKIRQMVVEVHDVEGRLERISDLLRGHGFELTIVQDKLLQETYLYNIYAVRPTTQAVAKTNREAPKEWYSPARFEEDLRATLKEKLPQYMIPAAFVLLDAFPLTSNGKLDRKALPDPEKRRTEVDASFAVPQTELEKTIANVWQKALQLDQVSLNANFFDMGGHSLLMVQVHSQLRELLKREFSVVDLFKYPTISSLAQFLSQEPVAQQNTEQLGGKLKEGQNRLKQRLQMQQAARSANE